LRASPSRIRLFLEETPTMNRTRLDRHGPSDALVLNSDNGHVNLKTVELP
jgi:hypothetical protein